MEATVVYKQRLDVPNADTSLYKEKIIKASASSGMIIESDEGIGWDYYDDICHYYYADFNKKNTEQNQYTRSLRSG